MRLLTLIFLPLCLWSQQLEVRLYWDGTQQLQLGELSKEVPSATDQTVFYDDQSKRFSITISKSINTHSNTAYSIQNIQTQAFEKELDLDLSQFNESPDVLIYKTKGRANNQVVIEMEPFVVKNNKLHTVTGFTIIPKTTVLSRTQRFQQFSTVTASHPISGFRFEVDKTGIYKITGKFLRGLGMPIANVDPKTLKIHGKGGQMIPLINSEINDYNYGFSENPLQLVGMDDGVIGEEDYILFYAYGSNEWNSDSQTAINLYHDKSHYIISHGGGDGLRVSINSSQLVAEDAQTSASVDLHFEEDLVNVAQMGRKWFGDRLLHNASKDYPFQLVNRAGSTPIDVKVAAAGSSSNTNQINVRVESESTSVNFSSTQVLTKATENTASLLLTPSSNDVNVNLQYDGAGLSSSVGYIDYIRLTYQRTLDGGDGQFNVHTEPSATYKASNTDAVWELHTNGNISVYQPNNGNVYFSQSDTTERFHLHNSNDIYTPKRSDYGDVFTSPQLRERLANEAEYIIVTHDDFTEEANKLAAHHRTHAGLKSVVLTLSEIYDDFSAGNIDIVAIRNAVRYAYLNNSEDNKPKYLCLFGDTSYDYKDRVPNNNMIVPTYHALHSFHLANSYMSDDFYTMMDDDEGDLGFSDRMDLAVGRILFDTKEGALAMVNKSIDYSLAEGDWQNTFTILSDDPDEEWETIIQERLDVLGQQVVYNKPFINLQKIHSDAYEQTVSASGARYPGVNLALENQFIQGSLAINYFGHGGESGLGSEKFFDEELAQRLYNPGRYPLFITSTCEFSRFDNPEVYTAGEASVANPAGGVIGLISTTRQIYVTNGISYNQTIAKHLFAYGEDDYPTIAEALRLSKNEFSGTSQRRIIFFIGDPALKLAVPNERVELTHINGSQIDSLEDSDKQLRALDRVNLAGQVSDENGELLDQFNGEVVLTIFDKEIEKTTLGNDGNGTFTYDALGNVVFKGNAEVENGFWNIELIIPKDISLPVGQARISLYAISNDSSSKKTGLSTEISIGGINPNQVDDTTGPDIELFLNDENFVSGDITGSNPVLIAKFSDENGINTSGGLGHELLAVLDGVTQNPIVLNNFYRTNLGDFQSGSLTYLFNDLTPGSHELSVTAWDTYNNPSTKTIAFVVSEDNAILINGIYNVPNPFETQTTFWVTHNKPREMLDAYIVIHDINGKLVWEEEKTVYSGSNINSEIIWNGQSNDGTELNKGVYLCTITLKSTLSDTKHTETHRIIRK